MSNKATKPQVLITQFQPLLTQMSSYPAISAQKKIADPDWGPAIVNVLFFLYSAITRKNFMSSLKGREYVIFVVVVRVPKPL